MMSLPETNEKCLLIFVMTSIDISTKVNIIRPENEMREAPVQSNLCACTCKKLWTDIFTTYLPKAFLNNNCKNLTSIFSFREGTKKS